jgi:hypothetical protein
VDANSVDATKHRHGHACACKHERVKYCAHCFTVYCEGCNQEWTAKSNYTWYYNQGNSAGLLNTGGTAPYLGTVTTGANYTSCSHE